MYNIIIKNVENKYDFAELIKIFLRPEEFNAYTEAEYAEKRKTVNLPNCLFQRRKVRRQERNKKRDLQ